MSDHERALPEDFDSLRNTTGWDDFDPGWHDRRLDLPMALLVAVATFALLIAVFWLRM